MSPFLIYTQAKFLLKAFSDGPVNIHRRHLQLLHDHLLRSCYADVSLPDLLDILGSFPGLCDRVGRRSGRVQRPGVHIVHCLIQIVGPCQVVGPGQIPLFRQVVRPCQIVRPCQVVGPGIGRCLRQVVGPLLLIVGRLRVAVSLSQGVSIVSGFGVRPCVADRDVGRLRAGVLLASGVAHRAGVLLRAGVLDRSGIVDRALILDRARVGDRSGIILYDIAVVRDRPDISDASGSGASGLAGAGGLLGLSRVHVPDRIIFILRRIALTRKTTSTTMVAMFSCA